MADAVPNASQVPRELVFGPFEVDISTGELLKGGSRIRLTGQPFEILMMLLKNPGQVVTREQLRERIWSEGTFVDFEHGLNAAINKLRRALGDSAEKPRYIETVPGRGYRFIGNLARDTTAVSVIPRSEIRKRRPTWLQSLSSKERLSWAAACITCLALGILFRPAPSPSPPWKLTRITAEAGISSSSTISPDGNLIAYSSDGGLDDRQDLYITQTAGAQPIRLTFDGAGNTTPDFSPDGRRIVFRSARNGSGIYIIPALGGEARLIVRGGRNPKFSPDGSQVAYWDGDLDESVSATVPGNGAVWIVPAAGGQPERLGQSFTTARHPIWTGDGKHLLMVGYTSAKAFDSSALDWWLVSTTGGSVIKTGAYDAFIRAGLTTPKVAGRALLRTPIASLPNPDCWSPVERAVVFSFAGGDVRNLWEIGLSPLTGKVTGLPRRLTAGSVNEVEPSCASGGTIAFTSLEMSREVWTLPLARRDGTPGTLERMTDAPANVENPSFSLDGKYVAFTSDQSGTPSIRLRDLATGAESALAHSYFVQRYPVISPSSTMVAYSVYEKDKRVVYEAAPGGTSVKLCTGCLRATDWSSDEKSVLTFGGDPYEIDLLDIRSRKQAPLLRHSGYSLLYGRFSPDQRWISFTVRTPGRARIAIAPVAGSKPVPESAWITIAEVAAGDYANWSPDGLTLYFTSWRDGHSCLWGQRIDGSSHRPLGEPFAVQHLHGRLYFGYGGWSLVGSRIGLALVEAKGNIWTLSRVTGRDYAE